MRNIGYLSFDASVKIHQSGRYASTKTSKTGYGGINGYIRHIDRGTDRRNGCEVQHSNPDINSDYTLENESLYKDENGNWEITNQSKDMVGAVNRRIQYAREHGARIANKGKNDTVIVRPIVVQLDRETIEEYGAAWVWDVIGIIEEMFNEKNIVGFSIHKDETNVHMHIVFVPCHERKKDDGQIKCAISQTKFFRNPRELAGMHRKIRKELKAKGYEIEEENKPLDEQLAGYYDRNGEWHQQGLTPDQLKQLTNKELNLKMEEIEMRLKKEEIDRMEQAMQKIQSQSKAKQEELDKDRAQFQSQAKSQQEELDQERVRLQSQQEELEKEKASVQAQIQVLVNEKLAVEQEKNEAKKMYAEANEAAEICRQIMKDKTELDPDFLEFLDKKRKRTGKNYRSFVEGLHREYLNGTSNTSSDWNDSNDAMAIREERKRMGYVRPTPPVPVSDLDRTIYSTPSL